MAGGGVVGFVVKASPFSMFHYRCIFFFVFLFVFTRVLMVLHNNN